MYKWGNWTIKRPHTFSPSLSFLQPIHSICFVVFNSQTHFTLIQRTPDSSSFSSFRAMAAARVLANATTTTTASSFLSKTSFLPNHTLPFNSKFISLSRRLPSSRKSFSCRALYLPEVKIKEEGQPETLDYRVFFTDQSGKKVPPPPPPPLPFNDFEELFGL